MNMVYATVIGILIAILMFGIKTGVGCGFSSIRRRAVVAIATSYLIISIVMGSLIEYIDITNLERITSMGMTVHAFLALLLIGAGVYTQKKWSCGCDVSKHTFTLMSLPCPVCLTALCISCMMLASTLEISGIKIGFLVGTVFFLSVITSSYVFRRMGKTPETLGTAMMFLGIFYLLGVLIVPAYMRSMQMDLPPMSGGEVEPLGFLAFAIVIVAGSVMHHIRSD